MTFTLTGNVCFMRCDHRRCGAYRRRAIGPTSTSLRTFLALWKDSPGWTHRGPDHYCPSHAS